MTDTNKPFTKEDIQRIFGASYGYYADDSEKGLLAHPLGNQVMYIPIMNPTENDVGFSYIIYMLLDNLDHSPHFSPMELRKYDTELEECGRTKPRPPKVLEDGIKKYRDTMIPKFVHDDIVSGKCRGVILDYSLEGFYDVDWDYVSEIIGIPKSKIVWLTGIYKPKHMNAQSEVTVLYSNFWERFLADNTRHLPSYQTGYDEQIQMIKDLKIRPYHGLSYNRRPHVHRIYLLTKLKSLGLLDKTSYSWAGAKLGAIPGENVPRGYTDEDVEHQFNDAQSGNYLGGEIDFESLKYIMNSDPVSFPGEDLSVNKADSINFDHIKNAYFQIISETFALNNTGSTDPFLSEKSYKPMASGMPFIIWGQTNTVLALSQQGYHTFEKWIDHSYDGMTNSTERLEAVVREIERLYSIPATEWSLMLKEMLPLIEENNKKVRGHNGVDIPPGYSGQLRIKIKYLNL